MPLPKTNAIIFVK